MRKIQVGRTLEWERTMKRIKRCCDDIYFNNCDGFGLEKDSWVFDPELDEPYHICLFQSHVYALYDIKFCPWCGKKFELEECIVSDRLSD